MFKIGTMVVYGNTGVCEVTDHTTPNLPGIEKGKLYYALRPLYQSGTIYCPAGEPKVFMRPVITREEAEKLIDLIPEISAEPYRGGGRLQDISEHYRNIIGTHRCGDLIEVIMSVYSKKQEAEANGRRLSQLDDRYMKLAEDLLYGELAVALDIPKEEVRPYIARRVHELESR